MTVTKMEEMLEEAIEYWKNKDKHKVDFLKCLLEISRNNNINGHKYVYAHLEDSGRDEGWNYYAVEK